MRTSNGISTASRLGRSAVSGVGLIEVMISVLVLGIGLLGIAAMQAVALRNSEGSFERSQGVVNTYSILDAMRANRGDAKVGAYNMGWTCTVGGSGDRVAEDKVFWIQTLKNNLNSTACGRITCQGTFCTVDVRWDETRAGGDAAQVFSTQAEL